MCQDRRYRQTVDSPEGQQEKIESDFKGQAKKTQVADDDGLFVYNADPGHDDAEHVGQDGDDQDQVDPG